MVGISSISCARPPSRCFGGFSGRAITGGWGHDQLQRSRRDHPDRNEVDLAEPAGTLDAATAIEVAGHIDPLRSSGAQLRIDLTDVTFIDTEGARALIGAADDAQRRGDYLEITGWSPASEDLRSALQMLNELR